MKHRYEAQVKALVDARADFAVKVYEDLYAKSTRDKMNALPEGWLSSSDNLGVQFGTSYERIYFNGYTYGKIISVIAQEDRRKDGSLRLLAKHSHGCAKAYEATHPLSIAHANLEATERDLKTEFEATRRQLDAALSAVTTVKRLIETWPEIAPFAIEFENEKPNLPALPTEQLNKILDLPVSEAA
jgi:hypothetical protein